MRPTTEAFRDAITAQGVTVYAGGEVPNSPALPYVVAYASTPTPGDYSHTADSGSRRWRISTLYVAASEDAVLWLAEKTEAALLGQRLTVAGLSCSKIRRESSTPIRPDDDAEATSVATDVWTFTTTNA